MDMLSFRNWRARRRGKKKSEGNGAASPGKEDGEGGEDGDADTPTTPQIDEEGYSVPVRSSGWDHDKSSFYSSSGTDSEEEREKRIHVEIKPLSHKRPASLSASMDELRSTVENLTLSPAFNTGAFTLRNRSNHHHPHATFSPHNPPPTNFSSPATNGSSNGGGMKRSQSVSQQIGGSSPPNNTSNVSSTSSGSSSIPRPPSRPRPSGGRASTGSPVSIISRTESIGSLERSFTLSRGPSPLTIGLADTIPLAVAFHEIVHACFKGNDETLCEVRMTGDMMLSFPAGILQVFATNPYPPQLNFRVRSRQPLENLVSNKTLVTVERVVGGLLSFEVNMAALITLLQSHVEQNPGASYFNIDILKYHITGKPGAASCPLHLVAFWKREAAQTDLRIDYKYNSHAMATQLQNGPFSVGLPGGSVTPVIMGGGVGNTMYPALTQVCVAAHVDGGVTTMQSKPNGQWFPSTSRACWKIPALSYTNENQGVGSLRARFEVAHGPSSAGKIAAQFSCENSTLSGCEFQLAGKGYRVSLIKRRFVSGKYTCDAVDSASRYSLPPGSATP